jgi:ParB-like chromosome segregation protein Spo0J
VTGRIDADLCARCGNQFPAGQICGLCADSVPKVCAGQPVARIFWVNTEDLKANDWNPNHQAPPENRLLKLSLTENGWTMPIVARRDEDGHLQIVDGYHKWLLAKDDPAVAELTAGMVPVSLLDATPQDARLATIRHNRARGSHWVVAMADIVGQLLDSGLSRDELGRRLQMDEEEVDRLATRGVMTSRGARAEFGNGWVPE